jgi:hypothetical protein
VVEVAEQGVEAVGYELEGLVVAARQRDELARVVGVGHEVGGAVHREHWELDLAVVVSKRRPEARGRGAELSGDASDVSVGGAFMAGSRRGVEAAAVFSAAQVDNDPRPASPSTPSRSTATPERLQRTNSTAPATAGTGAQGCRPGLHRRDHDGLA